MYEQTKSAKRRFYNGHFHNRYFVGNGIDIGGAPDPFSQYIGIFPMITDIKIWDLSDGDAQYMNTCKDLEYDFVVSSHCLEHMIDVKEALKNWIRIVKEGGYLIITVPDEDMYEQNQWPSIYNNDHKWTFTIHKNISWSPKSINILSLLTEFSEYVEIEKIEKISDFYNFNIINKDQTLHPNIESSIEIILYKNNRKITPFSHIKREWYNNTQNKMQEFSGNFSKIHTQVNELKIKQNKYIIYGKGSFGLTLKQLLSDQIVGFIDQNSKLEDILSLNFDKIIISVLGRENEVKMFLKNKFKIKDKAIICLTI